MEWMRRGGGGCILAAVTLWAGVGQAHGATIGNVTSFSTSGPDVTFNINDGSKVRISILADDMARVRIAPTGTFTSNVSRAVVTTSWPAVNFSASDTGGTVTITTGAMKLVVIKSPFVLECRDLSNNLILTDDPARRVQWDSSRTQVYKNTLSNEKYLGLGWRTLGLVRNGQRFVMNNVPNYSSSETFYSGIPLWYGMRNGDVYGIFFDDTSWGTIDMTTAGSGYMSFRNLGGQADYYYFAGPTMADVLDRYTELTGRPYMPPRWSVGYQQCRWSYTPQQQVLDIANEFRTRNIPCDVMYLDIDYMPGGRALTFDSSKFPSPASMLATLHNQGFRVVANISPFLFQDDPKYGTASSSGYFIKQAGGSILNGWHDYWYFVGGANTGTLAWIDFSKTTARNWWANQHTGFLNNGIDGIWNDLNEPDELGGAWASNVKYDFDGSPVDHSRTSTQYSLLQTGLSYDILANHYSNKRPFVVSRGGYAGIQRYATLWSGDNGGDWVQDYKRNIPMGLSLSISGQPHNGHDIGGFFGYPGFNDAPSPELYTRWMQGGVFSPFCRQHHDGWGNHDPNRPYLEPWRYSTEFDTQVEDICRDFIGLRYRLMPYLYTLFYEAHTTGAPIQRPTVYDFPDDPATHNQDYDFMFGPSILVSPITQAGVSTWDIYLPLGTTWIDWRDDSIHAGGQTINETGLTLEDLPMYVRAGAIIPMAPVSQYDGETPIDPLTLRLYPTGGASQYTLYEDDGSSWAYQSGGYARTSYSMSGTGDNFVLLIAERTGSYVPASRSYELAIHRWPGHSLPAGVNEVELTLHASKAAFDAADSGYYHDLAAGIFYAKFDDTGGDMMFSFGGDFVPDVPGDFDHDGDVDQDDAGFMQACLSGPGNPQLNPACAEALMDDDADVDQDDLTLFLGCMSGANVPGDPDCAD